MPSEKLFLDYLKILKTDLQSFSFRDKTFGWGLTASYTFRKDNDRVKKRFISPDVSSYYSYFLEGEIYRESCYSCKYANGDRAGDITIGDFWGIEQEYPQYLVENGGEFNSHGGISALLLNSEKGEQLINRSGAALLLKEVEYSKIAKWNRQLTKPSSRSDKRNTLVEAYQKSGYRCVEKCFRKQLGIKWPVRIIKGIIKRRIR